MMSIVINNPYSVNESLGFETAMNTTERIQSFLDDREGNAAVQCGYCVCVLGQLTRKSFSVARVKAV